MSCGRLHVGALTGFLRRERLLRRERRRLPTLAGFLRRERRRLPTLAGFLRRERRRLPPPALAAEGAAEGRAAVDAKVPARRRRRRRLALTDVARGRHLFDGCHLDVRAATDAMIVDVDAASGPSSLPSPEACEPLVAPPLRSQSGYVSSQSQPSTSCHLSPCHAVLKKARSSPQKHVPSDPSQFVHESASPVCQYHSRSYASRPSQQFRIPPAMHAL